MQEERREEHWLRNWILRYSITFGVCGIVAFIWVLSMGIFRDYVSLKEATHWNFNSEASKNFFLLTNGFFGSGIICTGVGLLILASNGGAFEMLVYGVSRFISLFRKDHNKVKYRTYYDYHAARSAEPKHSFLYLVIVGLIYIGISMIFLALYYQALGA
ncbi:MAG: DUF3899 domain-containing protein [Bacilli bacterium]|nr:DUF3899 domain-containing protein [Bacilli bacterium]